MWDQTEGVITPPDGRRVRRTGTARPRPARPTRTLLSTSLDRNHRWTTGRIAGFGGAVSAPRIHR